MKKYHLLFILMAMIIFGVGFYWFQLRPSHIRKECSWVAKHMDAVTGVTQDEINRAHPGCKVFSKSDSTSFIKESKTWAEFNAQYENICPPTRQEQPAKDWYEPASQDEYKFCLHSRGL